MDNEYNVDTPRDDEILDEGIGPEENAAEENDVKASTSEEKGEGLLSLALSSSLKKKLEKTAAEEGIDVSSLAAELLSEGVVLRAWEIIERKEAMRGSSQNSGGGGGGRSQGGGRNKRGNNRGGNRGSGKKGGNQQNNRSNWMEDKASFLEMVRNQEKRRR